MSLHKVEAPIPSEDMDTVSLVTYLATTAALDAGVDVDAREVLAAAAVAAPSFERIWERGGKPRLRLERVANEFLITVDEAPA